MALPSGGVQGSPLGLAEADADGLADGDGDEDGLTGSGAPEKPNENVSKWDGAEKS